MSNNPLVTRLLDVLGNPTHTPNPAGYMTELAKLVSGFSPQALDRAATDLLRSAGNRWPAPKAIVDACAAAQEALGTTARAGVGTLPAPRRKWPWELDAERAEAWAREFVQQSRWQVARAEGWERELRLWAQSYARESFRHGREPEKLATPKPEEIIHWQRHCRLVVAPTPASVAADELSDAEFVDRAADGSLELRGSNVAMLRRMASLMRARRPVMDDEPAF